MNSKLDFLFSRRSIRQYTGEPVSDEMIGDLLEAAMAAPSAVAKDPWHFIVVKEQAMRTAITKELPHGSMLTSAPVALVVCGDLERAHDHTESYMIQDCSAAIENILLAANALGLGACWLGVHPRENRIRHIRKLFQLPETIVPLSCIALGHPAQPGQARTRFREEAVHWERW